MTWIKPFFLLMGRASVLWVGSLLFLALSILLIALSQPVEVIAPWVDPLFLTAFAVPAAAGWLAGAVLQEFQGCTFCWPLPSINRRLAAGFLLTGGALIAAVAGLAYLSPSNSQGFVPLLAIGLAGYCLAGDFFSPVCRWMTPVYIAAVVTLVARSRALSAMAAAHPWTATLSALAIAGYGLVRLFSRRSLRRRSLARTAPFPGTYSLERSLQTERGRLAARHPSPSKWSNGYLGTGTFRWVQAATHEIYGQLGWRAVLRALQRMWALAVLVSLYAWSDKGDLGFAESLGRTLYQILFDSPHVPLFGEGIRNPLVILVIGGAGAVTALWNSSTLASTLAYPLSRQQRAKVTLYAGLVDSTVFCTSVLALLLAVGLLTGWWIGYDLRIDFIPYFVHPLAATLILMPIAQWGGIQIRVAMRQRTGNLLVILISSVIAFVALVWIWVALVRRVSVSPLLELGLTVVLLAASLGFVRHRLMAYFASADLV